MRTPGSKFPEARPEWKRRLVHGQSVEPPIQAVHDAVRRALAEDVLPLGDLSASLVPASAPRVSPSWRAARA